MDTKIEHSTDITKTSPPPMSIEISSFERELPYLSAQGVPFEIVEKAENSDFIRIRITIVDSYSLAAYGVGMSNYGYAMAKNVIENRRKVA